jgi:hypothetical protein
VREEDSKKARAHTRRFFEWQQEVRESREMLLEDLKAQARARGEDDSAVTLPARCYVKYGVTSERDIAKSADLKRAIVRAEAAAMRMSKGLTVMDVDAFVDATDTGDVPEAESVHAQ